MGQTTVCVIGAGPAGALLGASLSSRGHDVVILEAGERFDMDANTRRMEQALRSTPVTEIWEMGGSRDAYSTSGSSYRLNQRRVKGVGGSTLHWGATVPRMHPEDFAMRSRHGIGEDWPISYEELEPHYLEAEYELGVAGAPNPFGGFRSGEFPMDPHPFSYSDRIFEKACDRLGITLHTLPRAINSSTYDDRGVCEAYGTCNPACPSGAKYSANVHVEKAESTGATVIENAPVQRLVPDSTGDRIERASYVEGGKRQDIDADIFVVACGAVETPRLLLLSATGRFPDGLANSSGLVGKRFMEHVAIRVEGRLDEPTRQHLIGFGTAQTQQFYPYEAGPQGSMLITPLNNARARPGGRQVVPDSKLGRLLESDLSPDSLWGNDLLATVRDQSTGYLAIAGGTEMQPRETNRIALDRSRTDDLDNPVPDVRIDIDDHAKEVLERIEPVLTRIVEETGAREVRSSHPPDRAYFSNHQTGTTRMGTDPDRSVVNPNLRAHDIENLYISGGSVFVTGGPANPTLTICALTLRLAQHLHDRL